MNDELLIKFLLRETDAGEDMLVSEWIAADPSHKKQFQQIEQIWNRSKSLAIKSTLDENLAWEKFRERVSDTETKLPKTRSLNQRMRWTRIAAIFVLIAGATAWLLISKARITTLSAGQNVMVQTLPDGSEITLNKNSIVSYQGQLNGNQRNINFQKGEAFFKVKPDKSKPFVIEADEVTVSVVGTSFNVKHINQKTEVIVETGIVKVSTEDKAVELHAGEKVAVEKGRHELIKMPVSDQLYRYYRDRLFIADNTPLRRVVEVLSEAYNANITLEDQELGDLTLTSTFKEGSLEQTLQIIAETLNLKVERNGNNVILKSNR